MRRFIIIALTMLPYLVTGTANGADVWTGASWVWDELGATSNDARYFRHAFELKSKPKTASVQITADNHYALFINGHKVGADGNWNNAEKYDVAKLLVAGKNVVGVQANNAGGPAGLIARLLVEFSGKEKTLVIGTSSKWKTTRDADVKWTTTDFDETGWKSAVVLGGATAGPWNLAGRSSGSGPKDSHVSNNKIQTYRPASEEIEHFILPEGFKIELVAAEPLVINPVCVTLDERGRMYVSESHTYRYGPGRSPVKEPTNPIVRLDPRPDGKGYRRVLVAEGFDDPVMGMAIRDGKLWCTANNYLFSFDLTDAGPAENKQTLLIDKNKAWNPFGMFVLEWGPEGDLYLSVGNHNIDIGPPDQAKGEGVTGRGNSGIIVRMKPDGAEIERLVHGLRVPYSFDYDPFGQLWLLSNGQGNPNRFVRVIDGVDYHCYSRGVSNEWLAGRHPLAPPCIELPRGACTQLLRYYGAAFPKEYRGSLFLDNWGAHGFAAANRTIHRYVPDERNNIVAKEDFLVCRDPNFRCSHILYAPDGNLLIADWYGRDDESDLTGRIWKVSYTGDDKPEVQHALDAPQWKDWNYALSALGSPDHKVREKAVDRIVSDYGEKLAWPLAAKIITGDDPLAAAGALWALVRVGTDKAISTLQNGTQNPDWRIRRLSLQLMRRYKVEGRVEVARRLLKQESDPAVQLQAALCLTDSNERRGALFAALNAGAADDEHLRYEAAWHLADVADKATYAELLSSEDENLRLAGLVAIDVAGYEDRASKSPAMETLAQFLTSPADVDPKLLLELAGLHRSPQLVDALRLLVQSDDVTPSVAASALLVLNSISSDATGNLDRKTVQKFLEAVKSGSAPIRSSSDVLVLLKLLELEGPTEFTLAEIGRRVGDKDGRIRTAALELAKQFGTRASPLAEIFWGRILDPRIKEKQTDKLAFLAALLVIEKDPHVDNWRKLLAEGDPLVVTDAIRSFRQFGDHPAMAQLLADEAPRLIGDRSRWKEDLAAVAAAWKSPGPLQKLSLPALPTSDTAYQAAEGEPKTPDVALGRRVFERAGCVKCHTTISENTLRAPSLKGIGKAQKVDYLVESVLAPSKVIKTGFEIETVITRDGKVLSGLVKEEGERLRIITADDEITISNNDIDEREVQKKSLMPDGLHRTLSRREFADLIAYLRSMK